MMMRDDESTIEEVIYVDAPRCRVVAARVTCDRSKNIVIWVDLWKIHQRASMGVVTWADPVGEEPRTG